jgi:LysR family carnitine catabolism transcriptional activator
MPLINITFRQLQAFQEVARSGSFIKAAEAVGLSQPTLSAHVQHLESFLGVRLLDRATRNVQLTREGQEFFAATERLLGDLTTTISDVRALGEQRRGRVVVACLPSVAIQLVGPVIRRFASTHPGVRVNLFDGDAQSVAERVRMKEADFGFTGGRPDADFMLEFSPVLRDGFSAVCPRKHPLARHPTVRLRDVSRFPFIAMGPGTGTRQIVYEAAVKADVRLNTVCEIAQLSSLAGMIRAGMGVSILPDACVSVVGQSGLAFRRLVEPTVERDVGLITRKGRSLSPAAEGFYQELLRQLPDRWKEFAIRYYVPADTKRPG